jgi:hypothetical protein
MVGSLSLQGLKDCQSSNYSCQHRTDRNQKRQLSPFAVLLQLLRRLQILPLLQAVHLDSLSVERFSLSLEDTPQPVWSSSVTA